ncbi:thioredoxin-like protein 1 [Nannochloropsis oceanica]
MEEGPPPPPPPPSNEIVDITDKIAKSECFVLNADPKYPWDNLFMGDDRLQLRSDTDEQLVLHLVFSESVKVHSMNLVAPEPDAAPTTVKLYLNKTSFSFDDAESIEPTQVLELTEEDHKPDKVTLLKFVKFQRVSSLTIFIESNGGAEYTALSKLRLFGTPLQGTDVNKIQKQGQQN